MRTPSPRRAPRWRAALSTAFLLLLVPPAPAQWSVTQEAEVVAPTPVPAHLATVKAIDGDTLIIGAPVDSQIANQGGAAWVFVRSGTTWSLQAQLNASDTNTFSFFGGAADLQGDVAVIGASGHRVNGLFFAGAAYVFTRSGTVWTERAKLTAPTPRSDAGFGSLVELDGSTIAASAPDDSYSGLSEAGSVTVFGGSGSNWSVETHLTASDRTSFDYYGSDIALQGDTLIVGAWAHNHSGGPSTGAAYVVTRTGTTWTEVAELRASDGAQFDDFGGVVTLDGDRAVVGATEHDVGGLTGAGAAYVYRGSGSVWTEEAKLTNATPLAGAHFGFCSLLGDTLLVGARDMTVGQKNRAGAAFLFARQGTSWTQQAQFTSTGVQAGDSFGAPIVRSGDTAVIGAINAAPQGISNAGASYVFRITPPGPTNYCTAGTSAVGCQALLSAIGTPSATTASGFVLSAASVEGAKDGLFFFGANGRQANPWGSGTSFQCVTPPVLRAGLLASSGTPGSCDGSFAQDLNALWCPACPKPAKNPGEGTVVQAQLWYRDPQNTSNQTTSLSNALEFTVGP